MSGDVMKKTLLMLIMNKCPQRLSSRGLRSFSTLAGALIIKAFDHSERATVAMIQRGYEGNILLLKQKPLKLPGLPVSTVFMISIGVR
ncbi:MAG TPA: hypothetical protein ENH07_07215 [Nitrospirae bacterium]|nr:hypothetical protein BMS3Bbin05_00055 [bacterium BMS3Bbin05]HDO21520.1 hypothetical protein [Nitrospirota bacterium]HDO36068.1 hypothetical protein [Nitrospirota bacterium]HDZ88178.1 hypothetical protein [Nitrospirota bacterium]